MFWTVFWAVFLGCLAAAAVLVLVFLGVAAFRSHLVAYLEAEVELTRNNDVIRAVNAVGELEDFD